MNCTIKDLLHLNIIYIYYIYIYSYIYKYIYVCMYNKISDKTKQEDEGKTH